MTKQPVILVADDEEDILLLVEYHLKKAGYKVLTAPEGRTALDQIWDEKIDLVVLDIMMPEVDGLQVLKAIREDTRTRKMPVIMLTAKSSETDRIVGFELGADDYVCKPFSIKELVSRVKALLRRTGSSGDDGSFMGGVLTVHFESHQVKVTGSELELTPKEYGILEYLIRKKNTVLSREQILEEIWGMNSTVELRAVDVNIRRLREKLKEAAGAIKTIKGYGYIFKEHK